MTQLQDHLEAQPKATPTSGVAPPTGDMPEPWVRQFTRDEYLRLKELGVLHEDERVELIDGRVWRNTDTDPQARKEWESYYPSVSYEQIARRRWTVEEYLKMAELGMFEDQHVELIDGEIWQMSPQNPPHADALSRIHRVLLKAFDEGFEVRSQSPLDLGLISMLEPDLAVVRTRRDPIRHEGHPFDAELVIEISDTSLNRDRNYKQSYYARGHVQDYWIVNLNRPRHLLVYRDIVEDASAIFGYRYAQVTRLDASEQIAPLAAPEHPINVADLLP